VTIEFIDEEVGDEACYWPPIFVSYVPATLNNASDYQTNWLSG